MRDNETDTEREDREKEQPHAGGEPRADGGGVAHSPRTLLDIWMLSRRDTALVSALLFMVAGYQLSSLELSQALVLVLVALGMLGYAIGEGSHD